MDPVCYNPWVIGLLLARPPLNCQQRALTPLTPTPTPTPHPTQLVRKYTLLTNGRHSTLVHTGLYFSLHVCSWYKISRPNLLSLLPYHNGPELGQRQPSAGTLWLVYSSIDYVCALKRKPGKSYHPPIRSSPYWDVHQSKFSYLINAGSSIFQQFQISLSISIASQFTSEGHCYGVLNTNTRWSSDVLFLQFIVFPCLHPRFHPGWAPN